MSIEQNIDLQFEENRVSDVIKEIEHQIEKLKAKGGMVDQDLQEIRDTFWNDVTVNLDEPDDVIETHTSLRQHAELLLNRKISHSQIQQQLKTLAKLKYSPYFGRIDFLENEEMESESIYIGIASLMDKDEQNFLIYDWRAPISSLYYDYPPGPAQYQTPSGTISGEMELKRQFIIKNGIINALFDTGITIRDEMLQAVLGTNADTQMKSIVATIQKEQNAIIRNETSRVVVVQGVAGSGKTSAALQRVAYLLYRYRHSISPENIILFSPNPLFNSYISTVLPELGEENMRQSTFQEYLDQRLSRDFELEDPFDQMEYLLSAPHDQHYYTRLKSTHLKSGLPFKNMIDQYVNDLSKQGLIFHHLMFRKKIIVSKEQIYEYFYDLDQNFSIPNRIQLVKEWLLKELKKRVKQEQKKKWVEDEIQFLDKDDFIEAFQKLQDKGGYAENTFDDFEREQQVLAEMYVKQKFKPLFNRVKTLNFINMKAIYQKLFLQSSENPPQQWREICDLTINSLLKKKILYEDATPYVYLQDLIAGKRTNSTIRHIFIDEAQDYSPFQLAVIRGMFPFSRMTLLGDINQSIYSHFAGSALAISERMETSQSTETYVLNQTYRSTKPLVEFTRLLIENGDKIIPFNRNGNKPTVRNVNNREELHKHLIEQINHYKNSGQNTIALICKTASESKMVFEALKTFEDIRLIEKGTISFEAGVVIIPSYLAKGIEFDAVIIYDASLYKEESERKLFYTVLTRAMHELHLASIGQLSPLMLMIPEELYSVMTT
jgi:DNA helicase II / ATP-dependent DNA helicase PcrA